MEDIPSVLRYTLGQLPVSIERIAEAAPDTAIYHLLHAALEHLDRKDNIDPINACINIGSMFYI